MKRLAPKEEFVMVAHGRYDVGLYENWVYAITRTAVKQYAWQNHGAATPGEIWSLREARRRCVAELKVLAPKYEARIASVQRFPSLTVLQGLLARRGVGGIRNDYRLMYQAMFAFGSARAAAHWLMQPHPKFGGALPFMHATYTYKWNEVFDALVHLEYQHRLPPE